MASSIAALAASLENVAARLRRLQSGQPSDETMVNMLSDLEDEDEIEEVSEEMPQPIQPATLAGELARVESFVARARLTAGRCKGAEVPGSN